MKRIALLVAGGMLLSSATANERAFSLAEEPVEVSVSRSEVEFQPLFRRTQWLMFTAEWCPACRAARADFEPWLSRSGWKIDDTPAAHIRLIDGDAQPELLAAMEITMYPTFVLLRDGVELFRQEGYPGREALVKRYVEAAEHVKSLQSEDAFSSPLSPGGRGAGGEGEVRKVECAKSTPAAVSSPSSGLRPPSPSRGEGKDNAIRRDRPQQAINVGTLTGQSANIAALIDAMRPLLGDGGTLTMQLDRGGSSPIVVPLGERMALAVGNPLVMRYSLDCDVLTCRFNEPLPRGRFSWGIPLEQPLSAVSASVTEVVLELPRAPDLKWRVAP